MPPLLPRKIAQTVSVIRVYDVGLPRLSTGSASSKEFNEATSGFTCVTACCFANWELTTPCYQNAAPLSYRGERTTPRTGLKPVRYSTVTANGRIYFWAFLPQSANSVTFYPISLPSGFSMRLVPESNLPTDLSLYSPALYTQRHRADFFARIENSDRQSEISMAGKGVASTNFNF